MLFNTVDYGVLLTLVFALYWLLRGKTSRHLLLLGVSYFFYSCWDVRYLSLLVFSTALDYAVGLLLGNRKDPRQRRWILVASLFGNLGVLGVFKYYDFFADSLVVLLERAGISVSLPVLRVLLPVGISFYTFHTMSYTIDVYRGKIAPTRNAIDFALFVAFFPQLVAGPINRGAYFLPQLTTPRTLDWRGFSMGIYRILTGLAKKVIIADFLGVRIVDFVFANPGAYDGLRVLLGVYAYALQIYGDFSGYSDIAVGSAKLLGFEIPENFAAPYKATSLRDFWRRWHMSLSTWLRDYLYVPLGGSRHGKVRTYVNLMLTMLLGGLWHGAAWKFVVWGGLHGGGLATQRLFEDKRGRRELRGPWRVAAAFVTFQLVCIGWVFFRAKSMTEAGQVFGAIAAWGNPTLPAWPVLAALVLGFATHLAPERLAAACQEGFMRLPTPAQAVVFVATMAVLQAMSLTNTPFIYFQF